MIGAEANRIAASNAATPRYGQCNRQALQLFELPACNGNFLWEGAREGYLFSKKRYPSPSRAPCTVQGTKGPPANAGGPFLSPFGKSGYLLVHAAPHDLLKQGGATLLCITAHIPVFASGSGVSSEILYFQNPPKSTQVCIAFDANGVEIGVCPPTWYIPHFPDKVKGLRLPGRRHALRHCSPYGCKHPASRWRWSAP